MTATDLGFFVALAYITALFFRGVGISLGHYIQKNDPDLHAMSVARSHDDHPVSVWVARKLDSKREKSQKPRA